jgi:ATP-binding cassette, subfamily B, bacterial
MADPSGAPTGACATSWGVIWRGDGQDLSLPVESLGPARYGRAAVSHCAALRIGRGQDNDIVLADNDVSPHHCLLTVDATDQLVIQALDSRHWVYVNEQRILQPTTLRPGDIILIGTTHFRVWSHPTAQPLHPVPQHAAEDDEQPAGSSPSAAPGHAGAPTGPAWLEEAGGKRWYLEAETLIGRQQGSTISLTDPTVSRYHAMIRLIDSRYILSDLGSRNGTFVNDRALYGPHALQPGDRVGFGRMALVFGGLAGLAVASPTPMAIEVHQTPHFRINYPHDCFAAQQLPTIADRLEKVYGVLTELLDFLPQESDLIDVHLLEWLDDPEWSDTPMTTGGFARIDRPAIYEVYRPDSPGENLERSVITMLLGRLDGASPNRPPMLVEGLRTAVFRRLGVGATPAQARATLATAKEQGELPAIATVLASPTPLADEIAHASAASFLNHLAQAGGPVPFRQFLGQFDPANPDAAARDAYGQTLRQLERNWHKWLATISPGGIARFIRASLPYLHPHWTKILEMVAYMAFSVAFYIGLARAQGILLDRVLIPGDLGALATMMGVLVPAFLLVLVASLREVYLKASIAENVLRELRLRMFGNVQRLHLGLFQQMQSGDILSRMTSDLTTVELAFTYGLTEGLRMTLMLMLALGTIFLADWKLALLALLGTPFFFILGRRLGPATARASATRQRHLADVTTVVQENLGAQAVVKSFGLEERVVGEFTRTLDTLYRSALRLTFFGGIFAVSTNGISTGINLALMGIGAWLVIGGNLTTGTLFAFLALVGQVIFPIQSISSILQTLQQASAAMDRVQELINAEPAIQDSPGARPLEPLSRAIGFEQVTFGYNDAQPILRELDLTIRAGTNVALVGPSGCGKSTILSQILRFYEPQQGHVAFDGVQLREGTLASLRAQTGVVLQDSVLFNASVRENIRLGRPEATDAEVEAAAKAAKIHDLVMSLPQGFDTVVGERGGRLSGGQRQRIAIARAIIRNPAVLLLDEATSALDPQTEAEINETLAGLSQGRTTISVTHRLASVVRADQIFVFEQGRLVEQGTHDQLVSRGGLYARLWQEQHGGVASAEGPQRAVEAARLQRVPFFAALAPDLLDALAHRLDTERFRAGDLIVRQGEMGDRLYIIERGQVDVLTADPAGGQRLLNILRTGEHFGEMALLYDRPRNATVRARTPVQVYSLNQADFQELLTQVPRLRAVLEQTIADRQRAQAPQLADVR